MQHGHVSTAAQCPFYRGEDVKVKHKIYCGRLPAEEAWVHVVFRTAPECKGYLQSYCKSTAYTECPLYKSMDSCNTVTATLRNAADIDKI